MGSLSSDIEGFEDESFSNKHIKQPCSVEDFRNKTREQSILVQNQGDRMKRVILGILCLVFLASCQDNPINDWRSCSVGQYVTVEGNTLICEDFHQADHVVTENFGFFNITRCGFKGEQDVCWIMDGDIVLVNSCWSNFTNIGKSLVLNNLHIK